MRRLLSSTPVSPPRTVDEHPLIVSFHRDRAALQARWDQARTRRDALAAEREGLGGGGVTALLSLGKVQPEEVAARARQLDAELEAAHATASRLERECEELTRTGETLRQRAREDLKAAELAEVRHVLREMAPHFDAIERLVVQMHSLDRRHLTALPIVANHIVTAYFQKHRAEAEQFGIREVD